jgi:hypothetical protein
MGGVSKRQKVCDFATDAAGGATIDGNQVSTTPATDSNFHNRDRDVAEISATPKSKSRLAAQEDSNILLVIDTDKPPLSGNPKTQKKAGSQK